ncbi:unnamed protein product [Arctogadus glacialis]
MISIKRAAGDGFEYPCSRELTVMAKRLIDYYPMLRDRSAITGAEWESVKKQLLGPECDNPQKEAGGDSFKKEATEPLLSRKPGDVHRH